MRARPLPPPRGLFFKRSRPSFWRISRQRVHTIGLGVALPAGKDARPRDHREEPKDVVDTQDRSGRGPSARRSSHILPIETRSPREFFAKTPYVIDGSMHPAIPRPRSTRQSRLAYRASSQAVISWWAKAPLTGSTQPGGTRVAGRRSQTSNGSMS